MSKDPKRMRYKYDPIRDVYIFEPEMIALAFERVKKAAREENTN